MSNRQDKIEVKKAEQSDYLKGVKRTRIEERWEAAQIKAASAQSVLDYMVKYYEEHKEHLKAESSNDIIAQTEEQIALRKKEIEEFLMGAKAQYEKDIEEYNGTV